MSTLRENGALERLAQALTDLEKKKVAVGFFDTAHYQDGTPVAAVAAKQEFGDGRTPPRSFIRTTIAEKKSDWKNTLATGSRKVLEDYITSAQMLDGFGEKVAADIKEKIIAITAPPLSAATIMARRNREDKPKNTSIKPLVDTGILLSSVERQVSDK